MTVDKYAAICGQRTRPCTVTEREQPAGSQPVDEPSALVAAIFHADRDIQPNRKVT